MNQKALALFVALALCWTLTACGGQNGTQSADSFTVRLVCESKGIYQIFFSCYLDEVYYGMGAWPTWTGRN